jgi:transposase
MGKRRLSVRKIKEILRLSGELGLSRREIARSLAVSHNTVSDVLGRATAAQVSWPAAEALSEEELDHRLYPPTTATHPRPEPDPEHLHRELKRKGVTLQLLWLEYKTEHRYGLGYTQFCVDFAGQRMRQVSDEVALLDLPVSATYLR